MAELKKCRVCGVEIQSNAPFGHCPPCLIAMGFGPAPEESPKPTSVTPIGTLRYFGDYELLEEIARGGMGVVYKARQISLRRLVALKMISGGELASPTAVQRFHVEAEAAAKLDHPNIVPIYEIGVHQGQHYFSMKLVEGGSLQEWMAGAKRNRGEGEKEIRHATTLSVKIARAVHYAHQHGVLHRDIKPGNILLDAQGEPHITDFGLAKILEHEIGVTRTAEMMGTPCYMSPEQAAGKAGQLSTSTDLWSLGVILYELLTGRPPFLAETALETLRQVCEQEPPSLQLLNSSVDRDLETICLKCLSKDPRQRYGSAEMLACELERWREGEPILARPASRIESVLRWCRRKPAIAGMAAGIVLLASIGLAGWFVAREKAALAGRAMVAKAKADEDAAQKTQETAEILRANNEFLLQQAFRDTNNLRGPALLEALKEAIIRQPTRPALWQAKAEVLKRTNQLDDALESLSRAIDLASTDTHPDPVMWESKGELFERAGRTNEAFHAYTKAIEIAAYDTNAYLKVLFSTLLQRSSLLDKMGRFDEAGIDNCRARRIPVRKSQTPPELLDLSRFYNGSLGNFLPSRDSESTEMLSRVAHQNTGVAFDARGYVGLYGKRNGRDGSGHSLQSVLGIPINRRLTRLHVMHTTYDVEREGTQIGYYVLRFADGQSDTLPIVYGEDVRDRLSGVRSPVTRAKVAWTGKNGISAHPPKEVKNTLYQVTWSNPHPEVEIKSLDFVSAMTESGPVLIAITVEP